MVAISKIKDGGQTMAEQVDAVDKDRRVKLSSSVTVM